MCLGICCCNTLLWIRNFPNALNEPARLYLFECWSLRWLSSSAFLLNLAKQIEHCSLALSRCTVLICFSKWVFCPNDERQTLHTHDLCLKCTVFTCLLNTDPFENNPPHLSHSILPLLLWAVYTMTLEHCWYRETIEKPSTYRIMFSKGPSRFIRSSTLNAGVFSVLMRVKMYH